MRVIKAKAVAGFKSSFAKIYEVELWFEGDDMSKKGKSDQFGYDELLRLAGGQKGWNFKRVNEFLKSEAGLEWINKTLDARKKDA